MASAAMLRATTESEAWAALHGLVLALNKLDLDTTAREEAAEAFMKLAATRGLVDLDEAERRFDDWRFF